MSIEWHHNMSPYAQPPGLTPTQQVTIFILSLDTMLQQGCYTPYIPKSVWIYLKIWKMQEKYIYILFI